MKYFNPNMTKDAASSLRKELMKQYHTDCGGDLAIAQAINAEYAEMLSLFKGTPSQTPAAEDVAYSKAIARIQLLRDADPAFSECSAKRMGDSGEGILQVTLHMSVLPTTVFVINEGLRDILGEFPYIVVYFHKRMEGYCLWEVKQITTINFDVCDFYRLKNLLETNASNEDILKEMCSIEKNPYHYTHNRDKSHWYIMRRSRDLRLKHFVGGNAEYPGPIYPF